MRKAKNELRIFEENLMRKAFETILNDCKTVIKKKEIGFIYVRYGKLYLEACNAMMHEWSQPIEKTVFDRYMNRRIKSYKRAYVTEPFELPDSDERIEDYGVDVYWNNVGEISAQYEDMYLERFVKKSLVEQLWKSGDEFYFIPYTYYGEIFNPYLHVLQIFGHYDKAKNEEMFKKMNSIASHYNMQVKLVPEYMLFSRSDELDIDYIVIRYNE